MASHDLYSSVNKITQKRKKASCPPSLLSLYRPFNLLVLGLLDNTIDGHKFGRSHTLGEPAYGIINPDQPRQRLLFRYELSKFIIDNVSA